MNITLSSTDLSGNVQNVQNATVVLVKTGFSTHAMRLVGQVPASRSITGAMTSGGASIGAVK